MGFGTLIAGNVKIGKGTAIFERVEMRADKGESIVVGEGCDIQDDVKMHVSPTRQSNVTIGNYATLAHNAICHGATVGDYAFVALNAILNDGCVVGNGTFVDSGTVVNAGAILKDRYQYHGDVPLGYNNPMVTDEQNRPIVRDRTGAIVEGVYEWPPYEAGLVKDIPLVRPRAGEIYPLGNISDVYAKSQVLGTNARRWIQSGESLGDFDPIVNRALPAMAYFESAQIQLGKLHLQQACRVLAAVFHDEELKTKTNASERDLELAQSARDLVAAITVFYHAAQPTEAAIEAWKNKDEILEEISARLIEIGNNQEIDQPIATNTALRKQVLIEPVQVLKSAEKLKVFAQEMNTLQGMMKKGSPQKPPKWIETIAKESSAHLEDIKLRDD